MDMSEHINQYIVAITGASGAIFGIRLLEELIKTSTVYLLLSNTAFSVIHYELGIDWINDTEKKIRKHFKSKQIFFYKEDFLEAPIASGSFKTDGMFIAPCSMKTLSGIAQGYTNNLIERSADVILKESRRLIISPRETPLSAIHLENMLKLARLNVRIVPPIPAFYNYPQTIDDIINFIVGKLLDNAGIEHNLCKRWGGK